MRKMILFSLITLSACAGNRVAGGSARAVPQRAPQSLIQASAQQAEGERLTLSFSDPSRPGLLKVDLLNGAISVKAYNGREVIVDVESRQRPVSSTATTGLRRLPSPSGLSIEEQNNEITVASDSWSRLGRVNIQVPTRTNLKLHGVNGGSIEVEGVEGEIELDSTNGRIVARDVAGVVSAHAVNGGVLVTMRQVMSGKPMSFVSQNGAVDVTFPADFKANAQMRTGHGSIWTDFDVQTRQAPEPAVRDLRTQGGVYRLEADRSVYGAINGGGPDLTLSTFNGSIYIRRGR